jgi:pimeloyl-ACP methyl ester carboxylesterase
MAEPWTHHEAKVGEIRLHWVEQGTGPLVVLLHGFPEFWYAWRHQIPAIAAAGFRVVAPDLRGYNLSERPEGIESYAMEKVAGDVAALIGHLGAERAIVAGHDWGGIVAWWLAMLRPELLERLVIVNAPHPRVFAREIRKPRQLLKSWYAIFFQLPVLPEAALSARNYRALSGIFRGESVRKDAFTREDVRIYKEAAARPGALTAMLNYYRAARKTRRPKMARIDTPTLVIWGERDQALVVENSEGLEESVPNLRVVRLPEASHWVLAEYPDRANELMIAFLREGR